MNVNNIVESALKQLGDCSERTLIEIHGLLLHEAVHIWQQVRKLMGEKKPSLSLKRIRFSA